VIKTGKKEPSKSSSRKVLETVMSHLKVDFICNIRHANKFPAKGRAWHFMRAHSFFHFHAAIPKKRPPSLSCLRGTLCLMYKKKIAFKIFGRAKMKHVMHPFAVHSHFKANSTCNNSNVSIAPGYHCQECAFSLTLESLNETSSFALWD